MRKRDHGRTVMSQMLGRELLPNEIVHHRNGNHNDHSIDNLELTNRAGHIRIHKPVQGYKFTEEQKRRLSKSHVGQVAWNKGNFGFKHSDEAKANMSKAQKGRIITWGLAISKAKTKVTEEQLLEFIKKNPDATLKIIMLNFNLKTHGPIHKHGGIGRLKEKAKNA